MEKRQSAMSANDSAVTRQDSVDSPRLQMEQVYRQMCKVLWHLDIFRRSFRELEGHACMADSCIFCALKELFNQFQYSHESALPPDALRRALAETFANQQRFQLGFMDDAAECFENILLRIHFHVANSESEDMCNAMHCISHQKFAMTLVEQRVCHACGATSEPLPFTQMVHYISSSALCAQSKMNFDNGNSSERFGQLLRKACGIGEIRDCPSTCGAKIQIHRTLMNHPEIISIGIVWDSERPTLEHIMNVFQTVGTTIRLQDVFHSVVDGKWANSAAHQLVGMVTYYGKHYSTFFFHTKLRVWIYFDDATVREIGPHWEQVIEKCRRGHFQPLLLLYANPCGTPINSENAPQTVTYATGHCHSKLIGHTYHPLDKSLHASHRRAVTPSPESRRDPASEPNPRRAVTPNAELHHQHDIQQQQQHYGTNRSGNKRHPSDSDAGYSSADRHPTLSGGTYRESIRRHPAAESSNNETDSNNYYNAHPASHPAPHPASSYLHGQQTAYNYNNPAKTGAGPPLRAAGYFNNCDVVAGAAYPASGNPAIGLPVQPPAASSDRESAVLSENIYISRRAVESVLNYQKVQRHQSRHAGSGGAGNRNSNSSLESFENALRMRTMQQNGYYDNGSNGGVNGNCGRMETAIQQQLPETVVAPAPPSNVPRCRDSGNWSGDRNSASSTSSASMENPYYVMAGNKRSNPVQSQGYHYLPANKPPSDGSTYRPGYDAGYDSFSLSSNDSFPHGNHPKHNQLLAQIPENVLDQSLRRTLYKGDSPDECQSLCYEADSFLEKSIEKEQFGDLDGAISLCNGAAAKARAAMDAPYSNPQILAFAKMKHSSCVMRSRSLHRRILARQDSINSHGSSTGTETDSPRKTEADGGGFDSQFIGHHHSRQSSRDSTRSRSGHHSRQSSKDGGGAANGSHSRQGSRDGGSHSRQSSQDASEKKRIELYGTLPKKGGKKKAQDKTRTGSIRLEDEAALSRLLLAADTFDAPYQKLSSSKPEAGYQNGVLPPTTSQLGTELLKVQRVNEYVMQKQHDRALLQQLAASSTDYSDYSSEWEHTRKPAVTLHRTNSIPPNFHHQAVELTNSQSFTDLTAVSESAKIKEDANKINAATNNAKLGKKQHKIRRKLLMGGLIRRKNRSMPDLREGQNTGGPSPSTNNLSLEDPDESGTSYQNMYNDVVNRRLYSSHSKIPPPPPVRTTSQLTTRSLSQGNLTTVPGHPLCEIESIGPGPPLQPRLVQPLMSSKFNGSQVSGQRLPSKIPFRVMQSPPPTLPSNGMNQLTIQADVHHERTPSDNIRPVCLVPKTKVVSATYGELEPASQRNNVGISSGGHPLLHSDPRSLNASPYGQDPFGKGIAQPEVARMANDNAHALTNGGEVRTTPVQSGLLAELQAKRKQLLESAGSRPGHDPLVQSPKSPTSTGDNWLQELQAKQQLLKSKKGTENFANAPPKHIADPVVTTNGYQRATTIPQHQRDLPPKINLNQSADAVDGFSERLPPAPMVAPTSSQAPDHGDYKPKSVRDLASKFEKITVTPVTPSPPQNIQSPPQLQQQQQHTIKKELKQPIAVPSPSVPKPPAPQQWQPLNHTHTGASHSDQVDGRLLVHTLDLPHHHNTQRSDTSKDLSGQSVNPVHQVNRVYDYRPGFVETPQQSNKISANKFSGYNLQNTTTLSKESSYPQQNGNYGVMSPLNDRTDLYHNTSGAAPFEKCSNNLEFQHSQSQRTPMYNNVNNMNHQQTNYSSSGLPVKHQINTPHYTELDYNNQNNVNGWHQQNSHNMLNSNSVNDSTTNGHSGRKMSDPGFTDGLRNPELLAAYKNGFINSNPPPAKQVPPSYQNALSMSTMQWPHNSTGPPSNNVPAATTTIAKPMLGHDSSGPIAHNNGSLRRNHSLCLPVAPTNKEMTSHGSDHPIIDNDFKKKKGKKSVTFSDQIALVASADDDVMLPHPLLEKVLNRTSIMSKLQPGAQQQQQQQQPRPSSTIQVPVFNEASYEHMTNCNTITNGMTGQGVAGQYKYDHMQPLPATSVAAQMSNYNGGYPAQNGRQNGGIPIGGVQNGHEQHFAQDGLPKLAANLVTPGAKVPCHLCRKKSVVPPVVYCQDCDFYMSRFKPR